jgi:hypothetical protein
MMDATLFLIGTAVSLGIASVVVVYLRPPLQAVLTDLCGTAERARFWTAFSSVALLLLPLIFALDARPEAGGGAAAAFGIGGQVKSALIGLGLTLLTLGIVVGSFIPRRQAAESAVAARPQG